MWHVGMHIWDVDPNKIEPDYDEWYGVSILLIASREML
jgi:hypothetical protein